MLIAIDPGLACGLAWIDGDCPTSRLIDLKASSEGAVYARARHKFLEIINGGDVIGIEAMILPGGVTIASRLVLFGLRSVVVAVAYERGARLIEVEPHRWRRHFMNVVQAPRTVARKHRRQWLKDQAQKTVKLRGWGDVSADEADALGILDYLRATLEPAYAIRSTPLFERQIP